MKTTSTLHKIMRATLLFVLWLSLISLTEISFSQVPARILVGTILVLATFVMGDHAIRSGIAIGLTVLTMVWAISTQIWGIFQGGIILETQWLTPIMHLLSGASMIGLAEMLVIQMKKTRVNQVSF